jgi:Fe-S cluster assembly protein SufD
MNALDFYQSQAKAQLSNIPWLAALQKEALEEFLKLGFPTRHTEEWKYTSVDSFLEHNFALANHAEPSSRHAEPPSCQAEPPSFRGLSAESSKHPKILIPTALDQQITIFNGQVHIPKNLLSKLPVGIIIEPLLSALNSYADLIKSQLVSLKIEHAFQALNLASLQSGLFIYIPKGVHLKQPIVLNHCQNIRNQGTHLRHLIIAEENTKAEIVEYFEGENSYFTNNITQIFLGPQAQLTHYKIQNESREAYHIGHLAVQQKKGSECTSVSLSLGGKLVRSDSSFQLEESQARCTMNGLYIPADKQHIDHHTTVQHLVPNCTSEQDYKGILLGRSKAVFNGKVLVSKDAQLTEAHQSNKNILLSPYAEINTKPQLEIFADDVTCSHGATVGQLDEEALFYLATRGIEPADAKLYLIQAFAADNVRAIANKNLNAWMINLINQQLGS